MLEFFQTTLIKIFSNFVIKVKGVTKLWNSKTLKQIELDDFGHTEHSLLPATDFCATFFVPSSSSSSWHSFLLYHTSLTDSDNHYRFSSCLKTLLDFFVKFVYFFNFPPTFIRAKFWKKYVEMIFFWKPPDFLKSFLIVFQFNLSFSQNRQPAGVMINKHMKHFFSFFSCLKGVSFTFRYPGVNVIKLF